MSEILLVCPEPLGHRQPAGVGIRFLELARAMIADGQSVSILTPDGAVVEGCRSAPISPRALHEESRRCDVAVVQGHAANEFFAHAAPLPVVVDLYDPFIIENLNYYQTRGDQVFRHDQATLTLSLMRGDFFLCASRAQRLFYLGMLIALGRFAPDLYAEDSSLASLIGVVPFGVPPPLDAYAIEPPSHDLLFGGIYDWYDPILAIEAVRNLKQKVPSVTLTFNRHPNPSLTPQEAARAAESYVREHDLTFVRFAPWTPYEERKSRYRAFAAALLTFPQSLETELAMRTRIFDNLWAGLPVVCSSAPGTDEIIRRYGAGRIIESSDPREYAEALGELLTDRDLYRKAVDGARRYAVDHQWPVLLEPLLAFCREPRYSASRHDRTAAATSPYREPLLDRLRRRFGGRQ